MPNLTRRHLIQTGAAGALLLSIAGCAHSRRSFDDPSYAYRVLSDGDRALIAAIAPAMLAGALPTAQPQAVIDVVRGVDVALAGLPANVVGEVHQLFGLLEFPATRVLAAGVWSRWENASDASVAAFLTRWRFSSVSLFRSGYQALHQLIMASWYGNSTSWARIGYAGPPSFTA
jgi:hypothetical protein